MSNFFIPFFTMFFLVSCSTTNKIAFVSKKKFDDEKIVVSDSDTKPFEISDCAAGIIIIPINTFINFDEELENQCGKEWSIFDFEESVTVFKVPILYGQACREIKGRCKK